MPDAPQFDVFLCHSSQEQAEVAQIREQLKQRGINAWLDRYDFAPSRPWQDQLAEIIPQIKAVVIFMGTSGVGPWADMEMREFLVEFVAKGVWLKLVALPGCPQNLESLHPPVPQFLKRLQWIDFCKSDLNPLDQLVWEIIGLPPQTAQSATSINPFTTSAANNSTTPERSQLTDLDWFDQGLYKQKKGDNQGAIEDYTKAIQLNPNNATAYNNRGFVRLSLGDNRGAIADYTKAIQLDPDDVTAYYFRGSARSELGEKQGAISDYTIAIQLDPNDATAYKNRAFAREDLGDQQGAVADYTAAIQLDPDDVTAYSSRGLAHYELGDLQSAIEDYNQAIQLDPDYITAYYFRGAARSDLGDKQGAIADYTTAIQLDPDDATAYGLRGVARSELGDKQGAADDFQRAAELYLEQGKTQGYQNAMAQKQLLEG